MLTDQPPLTIDHAPTDADLARVEAGLRAFDAAAVGPDDCRPLALVLRDGDGAVRGGLIGDTLRGWLYVDKLWVAAELRGMGWGNRLLALAEREAVARGCRAAHLETSTHQAPAFYAGRGYREVGRIPALWAGADRIYLAKDLVPSDGA